MLTTTFSNLLVVVVWASYAAKTYTATSTSSSFDSLIATQCRVRCLALYPWRNATISGLRHRKHRESMWNDLLPSPSNPRALRQPNFKEESTASRLRSFSRRHSNPFGRQQRKRSKMNRHIKWKKVMELCSENTNCLQCSLPCDIPKNLLSSCKYLCKNHELCLDSCKLLIRLNEEKSGLCPEHSIPKRISSLRRRNHRRISAVSYNKILSSQCTNETKEIFVAKALARNDADEKNFDGSLKECSGRDSECPGLSKCCSINTECPQHGAVCQKPMSGEGTANFEPNSDAPPSIPFNLTIIERKKGKTVILKWNCQYNKRRPTIFVVEGRWSLNSPYKVVDTRSSNGEHIDNENFKMTKWGFLAQTVNQQRIILRSINRGRWYTFRVAAISRQGTHGYSVPTELFKLSSAPKPPSQPQNFTLIRTVDASPSHARQMNVDLAWLPSKRSDMPILFYEIAVYLLTNDQYNRIATSIDYAIDKKEFLNEMDLSSLSDRIVRPNRIFDALKQVHRVTLERLDKNRHYLIELTACSSYEQSYLRSSPQRLLLGNLNSDEDDDVDSQAKAVVSFQNSPLVAAKINYLPQSAAVVLEKITDLSADVPVFRDGAVKANLKWRLTSSQPITRRDENKREFKVSWFPIKCLKSSPGEEGRLSATVSPNELPTPISSSTSATHFQIYGLKFNCDYVVNVKFTPSTQEKNEKQPRIQVASTQLKVPTCQQINVFGREKPSCYLKPIEPSERVPDSSSLLFGKQNEEPKLYDDGEYDMLPEIDRISYKVVERSSLNKLYAVEFTWSLSPSSTRSHSDRFSSYQITIVPRSMLGSSSSSSNDGSSSSGALNFGSVGAIVEKERRSFVVRQLRASIPYVFQIQSLGETSQQEALYGRVKSLNFEISDAKFRQHPYHASTVHSFRANTDSPFSVLRDPQQKQKLQYLVNQNTYDLIESDDEHGYGRNQEPFLSSRRKAVNSTSSSLADSVIPFDFFQNSSSSSFQCHCTWLFVIFARTVASLLLGSFFHSFV